MLGRHFWRIENSNVKNALEKCFTWTFLQQRINVHERYNQLIGSDWRMACPCTEWQAWLDWGRFSWDWWHSWPELCYESRRSKFIPYSNSATGLRGFRLRQQCCYSTQWEDWGSLKEGPPDGGRVQVKAGTSPVSGRSAGSFSSGQFMQLLTTACSGLRPFFVWEPLVTSLLANSLLLIL